MLGFLLSFFFATAIQEQKSDAVSAVDSSGAQLCFGKSLWSTVLRRTLGCQSCLEGEEAMCADMKCLENYIGLRKHSERSQEQRAWLLFFKLREEIHY